MVSIGINGIMHTVKSISNMTVTGKSVTINGEKIKFEENSNCAPINIIIHGNVDGDITASGNITCGNVAGDVESGSNVSCGDVEGNVTAGSHVECDDIGGGVTAGSKVICGSIRGGVMAGGSVKSYQEGNKRESRVIKQQPIPTDIKSDNEQTPKSNTDNTINTEETSDEFGLTFDDFVEK